MRINGFCNRPAGEKDQEVILSAKASPVVGAPAQLDEDHLKPRNEAYPFSDIAFHSSEEIFQSAYYEEGWTGFALASSPESSETSAFNPAEAARCSSSPSSVLPEQPGPFTSSTPPFKISELHNLAAESVMQSPASFYPNSPTDSFADSDVPPLPPSSVSSSSALFNMDSMKMEITSAPRAEVLEILKQGNGDEPYCQLLGKCLRTMPDYSMSLKDIYKWFEENTTKTDQDGKGWQNSIRHNLSMNGAFIKQNDTHTKLCADAADKGASKAQNHVWTMTEEAVKNGVQSTTRYRKPNADRKRAAKRLAHGQQHRALPYGNYALSGNEFNRGQTMDRAAAGRRGGVATRHGRERQRLEDQRQQQHLANSQQSLPLVDIGNGGWNVPRTCSPEMMAAFPMSDHFRSGAPNHTMPGYMGIQGSVPMGHQLMYNHQLPSSSNSSTMGISSSHSGTPAPHMATIPGHPHVSLGCVPSADPRCGTHQASPQQQQHLHTAGAQPHQHNGGFHYGSPTSAGEYGSGNGLHQPENSSVHHPSFAPVPTGIKDWDSGTSGAGGV